MGFVYPIGVFFLFLRVAAAYVPPPTNVTLHCRNLQNTVEWTYRQFTPGLRFKVEIGSLKRFDPNRSPLWVDPPTLQADVSFFSNPSDDYYLTVTAVVGQNTSEPAPSDGIIFSYFQDSLAAQKCQVDLPPVNVTAETADEIRFRFTHPWLFYQQNLPASLNPKTQKRKRHDALFPKDLPVFLYDVAIINQDRDHDFDCVESVCEEKLTVDAAQDRYCLKITGELEKMQVQATQQYCSLPFKAADNTLIYVVVGLVGLVLFALIIMTMVFRKKTQSPTPFPDTMKIKGQVKRTMGLVRETIIVPELEPTSPTPLMPEKEVNDSISAGFPSNEYDMRLPIGVSSEYDEGVCDITEVGQQKDEYMQGTNLDKDEFDTVSCDVPCSYEKRPIFVELAPGEQAEGYRG